MSTKLYRPFAIVSADGLVVACACGSQYKKPLYSPLGMMGVVSCPKCGLRPIIGESDLRSVFGNYYGPEITKVGGLQPIPAPKDGYVVAITGGLAYPEFFWTGVTENGNFKLSFRYRSYNMFPRNRNKSRDGVSHSHMMHGVRFEIVRALRKSTSVWDEEFCECVRQDLTPKIISECIDMECRGYGDRVSADDKLEMHVWLCENLLPLLDDVSIIEDQLMSFDEMPEDALIAKDGDIVYLTGWMNEPLRTDGCLAGNDVYMITKSGFEQMFVMKKDGRLYVLDENPEPFKDLWKTDRKAYMQAKRASKRFKFADLTKFNRSMQSYDVSQVYFSDAVADEICREFSSWLGDDYQVKKSYLAMYHSRIQVTKQLFNRMVVKESGSSAALVEIARLCGSSNYKIIKYGPMNAVFALIGQKVKRKGFRKSLVQIATEELVSADNAREGRKFIMMVNLCAGLSKMANHGFSHKLYTIFNDFVNSLGEMEREGLQISEHDVDRFTVAIEYLEEFVSPHCIEELIKNNMKMGVNGYYGRGQNISRLCHEAHDLASSIEQCIEMGMTDDAIKMEFDRCGNSMTSAHNHFYVVHDTMRRAHRDKEMTEYELNDWQSSLADEVDDFEFHPEHPINLSNVGSEMSICVGSYARSVVRGDKTIVTMKAKGNENYHACLEITGAGQKTIRSQISELIQAKLKANRGIGTDEVALKALRKWAKKHDISITSSDCYVGGAF